MARDFQITVDPELKKIQLRLEEFNQKSLDLIYYRLVWGGNKMRNSWINKMRRTPKTGRKYKRGKKFHIASSPGQPPAVDTGQYMRSLVIDNRADMVEVGVKSGAPYAKWLEQGTDKIEARPVMEPVANAWIPRIQRRIIDDLEKMRL